MNAASPTTYISTPYHAMPEAAPNQEGLGARLRRSLVLKWSSAGSPTRMQQQSGNESMESVNLHQVPDSEQSAITPKQCRSAHDKEECPWLPALNALGISSPFEIPQFTDYKIPECKRAPNTYAGGIRIVDVIGTVSMAHLSATSGYRLARPRLIKA